jgi:acetyl-CoA acetyltransferase
MRRACIVGWAHTPFGKLEDPDVESLMARVSGEALAHAGIPVEQVDGIYVGVMNNGFSKQGFEAAQVALQQPGLPTCRRHTSRTPAQQLQPRALPVGAIDASSIRRRIAASILRARRLVLGGQ